ncbi:MAG: PAS domain S-box protein [Calditrichaeota bacterium]|nr:MAG: PAS domain S-box protein [Calditrichota bacterium]MBL1205380.1 PAS domain S-box protein [Calditrichota bacterium]NOG45209.1 PAS domain S-box protein [Calditrichota bacterium]
MKLQNNRISALLTQKSTRIVEKKSSIRKSKKLSRISNSQNSAPNIDIYKTLFEVTSNGVLFLNADGIIREINSAYCELLGYSREELVGNHISKTAPEHLKPDVDNNINFVLGGEVLNHTIEAVNKKGDLIYLELQEQRIEYPDGQPGLLTIVKNVTSRILAEEQLEKEKTRIQAVLDSIPGEISWISSDLEYKGVNQYLCDKQNLNPQDFIGKKVGFVGQNDHFKKFVEEFMKSDQNAVKKEVNNYVNGEYRSYLLVAKKYSDGKSAAFVGFDITSRKKAEIELKREKDYNRDVIQTAPTMIITIDEPDIIVEFNNFAEKLTGYSRSEVIGKSWTELFIPEVNREKTTNIINDIFSGRNKYDGIPAPIITRDGKTRTISWHNALVKDPIRKRVSVVSIGVDVTKSKKLEEQLRHSQKMEAVGKLAGGIAHDFNNLLTVIRGYTELMLMSEDESTPVCAKLRHIDNAAKKAANLTSQMLAFSRKQVMEPIVLDLNSVVLRINEMLSRLIDENISLITHLDPGLWNTKADPNQIEQVLMNMVVNARDAMPKGGKIVIQTENITIKNKIPVEGTELSPGDYILLIIQDTGEGIPTQILDKIFEPFFTTKDTGKGTGLGLATVYGIIRQSGGNISVNSILNSGTEFRIFLPRIKSKSQLTSPESPKEEEPDLIPILVVEDDPKVRALVSETLCGNGYKVFESSNGKDAIKVYNANKNTIKLILTDVVMPKMNGREFASKVKKINKEIKLLYMTGYADQVVIDRGMLEPNTRLIHKPFTLTSLLSNLKELQADKN